MSGDRWHCVIPYGNWHSVAARRSSINSYTLPLPFYLLHNIALYKFPILLCSILFCYVLFSWTILFFLTYRAEKHELTQHNKDAIFRRVDVTPWRWSDTCMFRRRWERGAEQSTCTSSCRQTVGVARHISGSRRRSRLWCRRFQYDRHSSAPLRCSCWSIVPCNRNVIKVIIIMVEWSEWGGMWEGDAASPMSMSMKILYSANSRRSNRRRWRVSD